MKSSEALLIYFLKSITHWNSEMMVHCCYQKDPGTEVTFQIKQTFTLC